MVPEIVVIDFSGDSPFLAASVQLEEMGPNPQNLLKKIEEMLSDSIFNGENYGIYIRKGVSL